MRIQALQASNFRCLSAVNLQFEPGLIAVTGPNASGKTSLLEAIFVAASGRSPRAARDAELVRWGTEAMSLQALFISSNGRRCQVTIRVELPPSGPRKRARADGKAVARAAELMARIPVVMFTPADLRLAQAEPAVRRRFMNMAIARLRPAYSDDLSRYRRALLQRNRLLQSDAPPEAIRPWTDQLVRAGAQVSVHRRWFAQAIARTAAQLHARLSSDREDLQVEYRTDLGDAADAEQAAALYAHLLAERSADEVKLARTLLGPHRDDLVLTLGGHPLRRYGSQGQQRTAALALKLAEATLLWSQTGESPILLLDDYLSELDHARACQVLALTQEYEQLIVTSASVTPPLSEAPVRVWLRLSGGEVKRIETGTAEGRNHSPGSGPGAVS